MSSIKKEARKLQSAIRFSKERARLLRSTKDREDEERFQEIIKKKILALTK